VYIWEVNVIRLMYVNRPGDIDAVLVGLFVDDVRVSIIDIWGAFPQNATSAKNRVFKLGIL